MKTHYGFVFAHAQRGAALFVALVFLIILAVLGLVAASNSVLQERMTGGMRNRQLAMFGVESAVRGGEMAIYTAASSANFSTGGDAMPPCGGTLTGNCVYKRNINTSARTGTANDVVRQFRGNRTWNATLESGARLYGPSLSSLAGDLKTASIANQPRFIIEDLGRDTAGKFGNAGGAKLDEPGDPMARNLYRITARSQGGSPKAAVRIAESVYSAYGTNHQYNSTAATP